MRRSTIIATAGALVLAACGGGDDAGSPGQTEPEVTATTTTDETTTSETPTATETATETETTSADGGDELALTQTCESERFTVDIPEGWWANESTDQIPACSFVHPEAQDDLEGESLHYAARLYIDAVAFEDAANSDSGTELSREETTVAGNQAVVIEKESDGDGLVPEGETTYLYIVDLGDGESLIMPTYTVGETDYDRDKRLLDRMAETLEIDG